MYELVDFGGGRKLERFGPWLLDRPAPAATGAKQSPSVWRNVTARFDGDRAADGRWKPAASRWERAATLFPVNLDGQTRFVLELTPLPSGQVGVFPEQRSNWQWIAEQVRRCDPPLRVLNLFAYTGGSTLAAAIAGAEVTHVDAAKGMVTRARENARRSNLAEHPIRWIVEDAVKFCRREVKRGNHYDAVILDPPSYGHGPGGEQWSIQRDLLPLLQLCGELACQRRVFLLATCHTPTIGPAELSAYVSEGLIGHCGQPPAVGRLALEAADGRKLPSGVFARWPG